MKNTSTPPTHKAGFREWTAAGMLFSGVALATAGFCSPPVGQIDDSVLYLFAQCLVYAGSMLGISIQIETKMRSLFEKLRREKDHETTTPNTASPNTASPNTASQS